MLTRVTVGTCLILGANLVYIIFNVLVCRLQKDWEAKRFIIYRRWTVESITLGKHTAQSSSLSNINESWRWQWPWEVIYLIHPMLLHGSVSHKHPWAAQACLSCAGWDPEKEGLQSPPNCPGQGSSGNPEWPLYPSQSHWADFIHCCLIIGTFSEFKFLCLLERKPKLNSSKIKGLICAQYTEW